MINILNLIKKNPVTDLHIFSKDTLLHRMLQQDADNIANYFHMGKVPVVLEYKPEAKYAARTDNKAYYLNPGHKRYEESTRDYKILYTFGALFHEVGHRIFTSFYALHLYVETLTFGKLYPITPEVPYEKQDSLDGLLEFISDNQGALFMAKLAHSIYNIIEDGRIENLLLRFGKKFSTETDGLNALRELAYNETQDFTWLIEKREAGEKQYKAFRITQILLLHYVRYGGIKGLKPEHKSDVSYRMLLRIKPYVDKAMNSMKSDEIASQVNLILIELWPEIIEYIDEIRKDEGLPPLPKKPKKEPGDDSAMPGTGGPAEKSEEGTPEDESSEEKDEADAPTESEECAERSDADSIEGSEDGAEESDADSSDNSENGAGTPTETAVPLGDLSEEEIERIIKSLEEDEAEFDTLSDEDFSSESTLSSDGTDDDKLRKIIERLEQPSEGEENTSIDAPTVSFLGEKTFDPGVSIKKLAMEMEEEAKDAIFEDILKDELEKIDRDIDYGMLHNGVKCYVCRPKVTPALTAMYNLEARECVELAKKMSRKSDFFPKDNTPTVVRNLYCGTKFNASTVAKADYRNFSKRKPVPEKPSLAVAVLVDESGSMCGDRIRAAKQTAYTLYEYCDQMDIPIAIYGHTADCHNAKSVELFAYCDFGKKDKNDRYRLSAISAKDNNRDGYALKFVHERLMEQPAKCKVLIVISDGQPAACYYSHGEMELTEMAKQLKKEKVMVVAAAIGSDKENIRECYGDEFFLDITDLNRLPVFLLNRLKSLQKSFI